jgi:hypothetical protein
MADLEQQIIDAAGNPAAATVDGNSMTAVPLDKLIEADKYLAGKEAAANKKTGLRRTRIAPPGSVY